jgi:UDP-N-acetyl-D-mannosaminuronic acid dehydrogenase
MGTEKSYDVCIIGGFGHVGLPLGLSFADLGRRVVLFDINETSRKTIASGTMPFVEAGAEEVLRRTLDKTLFLSTDRDVIGESRYVVIIIGTPVDEHLNPQFTIFKKLFDGLMDKIGDDQHIILRSTIYPGTTEKSREMLRARGKRTRISFCPERIAEGKAMEELRTLPQIVAAFDDESYEEARELFSTLTKDIVRLAPMEAELAKLFTNVWRYIQFGISNQFYLIAAEHGLDFYRIHEAITHRYPRAQNLPRAGFAAGPCLLKDTMQLAAFSNNTFFLGHSAMLVNEGLPNFIVARLKDRHGLRGKTVGILGMAFKGESDDIRESLSYKVRKLLEFEAGRVLCSDPFVPDPSFVTAEKLVADSDVIIIGAPHAEYQTLAIDGSKVLVDVWNALGRGGAF